METNKKNCIWMSGTKVEIFAYSDFYEGAIPVCGVIDSIKLVYFTRVFWCSNVVVTKVDIFIIG
jgi:hypothetical protein